MQESETDEHRIRTSHAVSIPLEGLRSDDDAGDTTRWEVVAVRRPKETRQKPKSPSFNADQIPDEMRQADRWLVWRFEIRDPEKKPTKVPFSPATGFQHDVTDPSGWVSFKRACDAADQYDGIGFVLGDGWVGVDFDECRKPDTTELEPFAAKAIDKIRSYSEVSVSETGVHIIARGTLPPGSRRKGRVEMYDTARYFTVTGRPIRPFEIGEKTAELAAFHRQVFSASDPQRPAASTVTMAGGFILKSDAWPPVLKLDALIENDPRFDDTWRMRRSDLGKDHSAYELALLDIAARAKWTAQELADLMIGFRRKHCPDDLRIDNKSKYEKTIAKALEHAKANPTDDTDDLIDTLLAKDLPTLILELSKRWSDRDTTITYRGCKRYVRVDKMGAIKWIYEYDIEQARHPVILTGDELSKPSVVHAAICEATGLVPPYFAVEPRKGSNFRPWRPVYQLMLAIAEDSAAEDDRLPDRTIVDLLRRFIGGDATHHPRWAPDYVNAALDGGTVGWKEGETSVLIFSRFTNWLSTATGEKNPTPGRALERAGYEADEWATVRLTAEILATLPPKLRGKTPSGGILRRRILRVTGAIWVDPADLLPGVTGVPDPENVG